MVDPGPEPAQPELAGSWSGHLPQGRNRNAGTDYDPERWEGVARDLGITDAAAVIGHRDVLGDPAFAPALKDLLAVLRATPLGRCSQIQWLL